MQEPEGAHVPPYTPLGRAGLFPYHLTLILLVSSSFNQREERGGSFFLNSDDPHHWRPWKLSPSSKGKEHPRGPISSTGDLHRIGDTPFIFPTLLGFKAYFCKFTIDPPRERKSLEKDEAQKPSKQHGSANPSPPRF
ncbi:hypothetical protein U9M48_004622 [Paspalum notatum var. saurae]|uniref:Uncharacterized protein n=1 Tax=Paspalum notatum var. saurae TaxID=547442 RepID=A0AAQ3SJ78_PASNO